MLTLLQLTNTTSLDSKQPLQKTHCGNMWGIVLLLHCLVPWAFTGLTILFCGSIFLNKTSQMGQSRSVLARQGQLVS